MNWKTTLKKKIESGGKVGRTEELSTLLLLRTISLKLSMRNTLHFEDLYLEIDNRLSKDVNVSKEEVDLFYDKFLKICEENEIEIILEDS